MEEVVLLRQEVEELKRKVARLEAKLKAVSAQLPLEELGELIEEARLRRKAGL